MNKEAIELVKKVKSDLWDYTSPNVNVKNEKLSEDIELLDQVLALLTEQPPAGDFTKECRELLKKGAADEQWEYATKLGEACKIIDRSEASRGDYERRLKAHIAGEAVKGFCRDCRKPFWNVDDEDITCPFCGWKGFPVPDIDAEQIA